MARSLMIAPAMPSRTGNGLAMRLGVFLEALRRVANVDLLVLPVAAAKDLTPALPDALGVKTTVIPVAGRQDTLFRLLSRLHDGSQRLAALRSYGRSSVAAHLSAPVLADVAAFAGEGRYDLVHVGRAYMAEAGLKIAGDHTLTLDIDENDAAVYRRLANVCARARARQADAFALAEADAHEAAMRRYLPGYDAHFISSAAEAASMRQVLGDREPIVVANGASACIMAHRHDDQRTLVFVGTLGYEPNADGLCWFIERVWSKILANAPRPPRLLIAGRGRHARIEQLASRPGVQLLGEVPDVGAVYASATVAIAPLHAGGGTRIKIVEAALTKIPVVATHFAAAGLPLESGRDLWLADDATGFAAAVLAALRAPQERARRARRAMRRLVPGHQRSWIIDGLACQFQRLAANSWCSTGRCRKERL